MTAVVSGLNVSQPKGHTYLGSVTGIDHRRIATQNWLSCLRAIVIGQKVSIVVVVIPHIIPPLSCPHRGLRDRGGEATAKINTL